MSTSANLVHANRKNGKEGSQFIIVTHAFILPGIPDAKIISFEHGGIHKCEYEDTESYQVMEMFLNNKEGIFHQLLQRDD